MSEVNPILLLILALLGVVWVCLVGLTIYVADRIATHRRRKAWPYLLAAIVPVLPAIGYLAYTRRRSVAAWVVAQTLALAAVAGLTYAFLPQWQDLSLLGQLGFLAGLLAVIGAPLAALSLLRPAGPKATPAGVGVGPMIVAGKLHKTYQLGARSLHVLRGVSVTVARGEFVAILGASGSGKSTLLHLLGLLDVPDSGSVVLDGVDSTALRSAESDTTRCRDIGFVFQFYHLLPELTVLENTLLPVMTSTGPWRWLAGRGAARKRAVELLERLGLTERLKHRPRELSGGEQQRVAIARALMNAPKILLADEPTGNLDSHTGGQILQLLKQLNRDTGQTIVMVTHDQSLAKLADRVVHLVDGKLA